MLSNGKVEKKMLVLIGLIVITSFVIIFNIVHPTLNEFYETASSNNNKVEHRKTTIEDSDNKIEPRKTTIEDREN